MGHASALAVYSGAGGDCAAETVVEVLAGKSGMSKHTATPWAALELPERSWCVVSPEGDAELGNWLIASHIRRKQDVALIVRAVNSHAALLAALKEVTATLAYLKGEDWETIKNARMAIDTAESPAP